MSSESWSIKIQKDYLKFSAAHFLIFEDGSAERLHGHNYRVAVELRADLGQHGLVLLFQSIKPLVREICQELNEHLLLPGEHPVLTAEVLENQSMEIRYLERYYVVPSNEVIVLPVNNTSVENLAAYVGREILRRVEVRFPDTSLRQIIVSVEETPGQQAMFTLEL